MAFIVNPGGAVHSVNDADVPALLVRPATTLEDQAAGKRFRLATEEEIADWHAMQHLEYEGGIVHEPAATKGAESEGAESEGAESEGAE